MLQKLIILLIILLIPIVMGATYYVTDPDNCPSSDATNFPGQNCAPQDICGDSSGTAQCYTTSGMNPPTSSTTTTGSGGTDYSCSDRSCSGGFVTNCYATIDASAPYCDNGGAYLCDRNSTCYTKHTQTTCLLNTFNSSQCSATCTTGYVYCDGSSGDADGCEVQSGSTSCAAGDHNNIDASCICQCDSGYTDCDEDGKDTGNGCEIYTSGSCSIGVLEGTYGGDCICDISDQDIATTGTEVLWSGVNPMLWMTLYSDSVGINMSFDISSKSFIVNSSGVYWDNYDLSTDTVGSGGGSSLEGGFPWLYNNSDYMYWNVSHGNLNYYNKSDTYNKTEIDNNLTSRVNINGDTMSGGLILPNITVRNITSTVAIDLKPNSDKNDFIRFQTTSNVPYLKIIGGGWLYLESDDAATVTWGVQESGSKYFDHGFDKAADNGYLYSTGELDIYAKDSGDYLQISTTSDNPSLAVIGGGFLNLSSPLRLYNQLNMTRKNITNVNYTCYTPSCSSYIHHNGTHLIIQT